MNRRMSLAPAPTLTEKRRYARTRHDSALELSGEDGRPLGAGRLMDVSAGGARFACTLALAPGRRVRGRLRLLRTGPLDVTGRIVWTREKENVSLYGLEFDAVTRVPRPRA